MKAGAETVFRWVAAIGAAFDKLVEHLSRAWHPGSNITADNGGGSAVEQTGAAAAATESVAANPTSMITFTAPVTADAQISHEDQSNHVARFPSNGEIQRRRELVRTLFNDFWSGRYDKPAAFVDRLDQAEAYLNERLTACGEHWQLDAKTRVMLSLPPRSNSATQGNGDNGGDHH